MKLLNLIMYYNHDYNFNKNVEYIGELNLFLNLNIIYPLMN